MPKSVDAVRDTAERERFGGLSSSGEVGVRSSVSKGRRGIGRWSSGGVDIVGEGWGECWF